MEDQTSDNSKTNSLWDSATTRALVTIRLKYENDFRKSNAKKYPLWEAILDEMREENPNMNVKLTTTEIMRKFNNLMHSYKRIRDRGRHAGEKIATTTWEYYEDFDAVYGDWYSPPISPETVQSKADNSPADPLEVSVENDDNDEEYIPDSEPLTRKRSRSNEASSSRPLFRKKRKQMKVIGARASSLNAEILVSSLKEYDVACEKRHRQNLKVEFKKMKIEQENMKVLKDMRDILREFRC